REAQPMANCCFWLASLVPLRTSPARLHSRHTRVVATAVDRSPARPAREMGDTRRQVSWLAAQSRRLRLPAGFRQWLLGRRSPLTVAGAAAALRPTCRVDLAPRSLFTATAR